MSLPRPLKNQHQHNLNLSEICPDEPDHLTTITYNEFIAKALCLAADSKQREWLMKLWARYGSTSLSEKLFQEYSLNSAR